MQAASERMDFESAAAFRDRIRALTHIQTRQLAGFDGDIHVLYRHQGLSCV